MSTEIRGRPVLRSAGYVATKSCSMSSCIATEGVTSADIGGRPVLRPAGNVAVRREKSKPLSSPVKPTETPIRKTSPPDSQPSTPRIVPLPQSRSSVLKPAILCKPPPSPSSRKTPAVPHSPTKKLCLPPDTISLSNVRPSGAASRCAHSSVGPCSTEGDPAAYESVSITDSLPHLSLDLESVGHEVAPKASGVPVRHCPRSPVCQQRRIGSHTNLTRSSADVFSNGYGTSKAKSKTNIGKVRSLSLDDVSFVDIMSGKKAAANDRNARMGKQGKASRVAPDVGTSSPLPNEPRRCKFITAQSDPLYVAYHDEEWGVPVHDDRTLFELLILAGAQVELSWSTILHKRETYRAAFSGFDPAAVANFKEKHIQSLEADRSLFLPGGMIRGVVENAQRILEIREDNGSLDNYLWGFLNHKPLLNSYKYAKQVPAKTSKAEGISKDLVKRGFRFVGPTIIYSFMQAAGMTNDHLEQCFRHKECEKLSSTSAEVTREKLNQEQSIVHCQCEVFALPLSVNLETQRNEDERCIGNQEHKLENRTGSGEEEESFPDGTSI